LQTKRQRTPIAAVNKPLPSIARSPKSIRSLKKHPNQLQRYRKMHLGKEGNDHHGLIRFRAESDHLPTQTTMSEIEDFAVQEYQRKIMSVLYQIDGTFAGIANELAKNHCPEYLWTAFSESWDALKKLLHEIETSERKNND
jgi:hypothetical protein